MFWFSGSGHGGCRVRWSDLFFTQQHLPAPPGGSQMRYLIPPASSGSARVSSQWVVPVTPSKEGARRHLNKMADVHHSVPVLSPARLCERSSCCQSLHAAVLSWDGPSPLTPLQNLLLWVCSGSLFLWTPTVNKSPASPLMFTDCHSVWQQLITNWIYVCTGGSQEEVRRKSGGSQEEVRRKSGGSQERPVYISRLVALHVVVLWKIYKSIKWITYFVTLEEKTTWI